MEGFDLPQESRDVQAEELEIVTGMLRTLRSVPQESRRRILETVIRFFELHLEHPVRALSSHASSPDASVNTTAALPTFSEDRSISPKQFMFQKQPRTDVEKVACLAYYLTHYRDNPHFKTLDISTLNTEAAQTKFSNPAVAVDNATKQHYLVPAIKGNKQLSAIGEQFVLALPDRDKARDVMSQARPQRRRRRDNTEA